MNHTKDSSQSPTVPIRAPGLIQTLNKGLGAMDGALAIQDIPALQWNLLREDLSLPTAVLYEEKLAHNAQWMQNFVKAYGAKFAPHGKTTMSPKLFHRQLEGGAWGITLATAHQTRVAYEHGVRRVLMANQLVGKQNMAMISRLLRDPSFEYFCLVDSVEQIELLGKFFAAQKQKLNLLLEVGVDGGRTGVRNLQQVDAVTTALSRWREILVLCGVELFEGVLKDEPSVRKFSQFAVEVAGKLEQENHFDRQPIILSGAGSAWYDVVAEIFSQADLGRPFEVILRPGCYLTHDVGVYRTAQEQIQIRNSTARKMGAGLVPALQLWAYVQSVPEKSKAIVGFGKRDAAFDAGLPTPAFHYRPGNPIPTAVPATWTVTSMMDQHAFLHIAEGDDIHVGDMIGFDISHPCLTFDKWRYLPVLDKGYRVIDVVETFF
jgi:D-serine dehydratase